MATRWRAGGAAAACGTHVEAETAHEQLGVAAAAAAAAAAGRGARARAITSAAATATRRSAVVSHDARLKVREEKRTGGWRGSRGEPVRTRGGGGGGAEGGGRAEQLRHRDGGTWDGRRGVQPEALVSRSLRHATRVWTLSRREAARTCARPPTTPRGRACSQHFSPPGKPDSSSSSPRTCGGTKSPAAAAGSTE